MSFDSQASLSRRTAEQLVSPAVMDALEERRMLSVSLSKGGTLSIAGTRRSDVIYATMHRKDKSLIDVSVNGQVTTVPAAGVKTIVMVGGQGNDKLIMDDSHGTLIGAHDEVGGDGNDTLIGDAGNDTLEGDAGDDSLVGNGGNDNEQGDAGDDSLQGDNGNDTVDGGDGNDSLDGGAGTDKVTGGNGADHFHGNDDSTSEIQDKGSDDSNDDNGGDSGGGGDVIVASFKTSKDLFA